MNHPANFLGNIQGFIVRNYRFNRLDHNPVNRTSVALGQALLVWVLTCGVIFAFPSHTWAKDPGLDPWKREVELGFVMTQGNTQTRSLNASGKLSYEGEQWRHEILSNILYSEDQDSTTAQRFVQGVRTDYILSAVGAFVGKVRYENDRFSGYVWRVTESIGYARRLLNSDRIFWEFILGPGGRHSELNDGSRQDEALIHAASQLKYHFNHAAVLSEDLTVESGKNGTVTESVTALKTLLTSFLAMNVSFTVHHNTQVPDGTKEADLHTAITLVYHF